MTEQQWSKQAEHDEAILFLSQPPTPENLQRIGWGCGALNMSPFSNAGWRLYELNGRWFLEHRYLGAGCIPAPATMGDLIAGLKFLGIPCEEIQ